MRTLLCIHGLGSKVSSRHVHNLYVLQKHQPGFSVTKKYIDHPDKCNVGTFHKYNTVEAVPVITLQ